MAVPCLSMDMMDGFIGALTGGVLTLIGSFGAIRWQLSADSQRRKQEREANRVRLLASIYHEVEASWKEHQIATGDNLEDTSDDQVFPFISPSPANIYVIYDSSAKDIGLIDDYETRSEIISTYIQMKCVQEVVKMNNENVRQLNEVEKKSPSQGFEEWEAIYKAKRKMAQHSSSDLKLIHSNTQKTVTSLLKRLRPYVDKLAES